MTRGWLPERFAILSIMGIAWLCLAGGTLVNGQSGEGMRSASGDVYLNEPLNPYIESAIRYYTVKERRFLVEGLERGAPYIRMIRGELRKRAFPQELIWIPFVESGFDIHAVSGNYAAGMWQFMPIMARKFGLRVDDWIDERVDPYESTESAMTALKYFHDKMGSWLLALAAYNAGEGRIREAINTYHSRDFWELVKQRAVPSQTKFYVAAVLAMHHVTTHLESFGLREIQEERVAFDQIYLQRQVDLHQVASILDVPIQVLQELNPAMKKAWTPPSYDDFVLRLPEGTRDKVSRSLEADGVLETQWVVHHVKAGDTLSFLASKYRSSVTAIQNANLLEDTLLQIGWRLVIPRNLE